MTRPRPRRVSARVTAAITALAILAGLSGGLPAATAAADDTASVSGVVTGQGGEPIGNGYVHFRPHYSGDLYTARTNASGGYAISGLPSGDYRVQFSPYHTSNWVEEYWEDAPTMSSATLISLEPGEVLTGIDAELTPGASISGTVTDAEGEPVYRAVVAVSGPVEAYAQAITNSRGEFTIIGRPAGSYALRVSPRELGHSLLADVWWEDAADAASATRIDLAAGESRTGLDLRIGPGATLSGRVVDLDGNPMSDVLVSAHLHGDSYSRRDISVGGAYTIEGLLPGRYEVRFSWETPVGRVRELWQDAHPLRNDATPMEIVIEERYEAFVLDDAQVGGYVTRIAGSDRYATAAAVSESAFVAPAAVQTVYVASGEDFPDALAGAPVAGLEGAPVLLTRPNALPQVVADEIARLAPERVVILGGEPSVSAAVADRLAELTAGAVERLAGMNRYATAVEVSRSTFDPESPVVYLASGENFPDALAAASLIGQESGPLLLTAGDRLPTVVAEELARLRPGKVVVLGGEPTVSAAVADAVAAVTSAPVERLAGVNRYATAAEISASAFDGRPEVLYIASGEDFPDALAVAPVAVATGAALLLTDRWQQRSKATFAEIERLRPTASIILGDESSIGGGVESTVDRLRVSF